MWEILETPAVAFTILVILVVFDVWVWRGRQR